MAHATRLRALMVLLAPAALSALNVAPYDLTADPQSVNTMHIVWSNHFDAGFDDKVGQLRLLHCTALRTSPTLCTCSGTLMGGLRRRAWQGATLHSSVILYTSLTLC